MTEENKKDWEKEFGEELEKRLRKLYLIGWEAGKKQKETPYQYTANSDMAGSDWKWITRIIRQLLAQTAEEAIQDYQTKYEQKHIVGAVSLAKLEVLKELLERFTEGNFIGISSVHKMIEEINK